MARFRGSDFMLESGVELLLLLTARFALTKEITGHKSERKSLLRLGELGVIQFEGFNTMVLGCLD